MGFLLFLNMITVIMRAAIPASAPKSINSFCGSKSP